MISSSKLKASVFALALISPYASAGFVHSDVQIAGDARATLHEETGLEWLKFPNTTDMSLNEVQADPKSRNFRELFKLEHFPPS